MDETAEHIDEASSREARRRRRRWPWVLAALLVVLLAPAAFWLFLDWAFLAVPGGWETEAWGTESGLAGIGRVIEADPTTINAILPQAAPGDTILLADGEYATSPRIELCGVKGKPITVKARGERAVFTSTLSVTSAEWLVLDGLKVSSRGEPGERSHQRGIRLQRSRYCIVRHCVMSDIPGGPGIYCGDVYRVILENNRISNVMRSHGICVFGGSRDVIVRGNHVFDAASCGIYFDAYTKPGARVSSVLVEGNIVARTGRTGGAALNCTNVTDSLFRNNLIYKNEAGGIVFYLSGEDQTNWDWQPPQPVRRGFMRRFLDIIFRRPPPSRYSPDCMRNAVLANTVYFDPGQGRYSFKLLDNSSRFRVSNNIFVGGKYETVSVAKTALRGLDMDHNLIATYEGQPLLVETSKAKNGEEESLEYTAQEWRAKGLDEHSTLSVDPRFVSVERDDYHLLPDSPAIDAGRRERRRCREDLDGVARPQGKGFDCGAYEYHP